MKKRVSLLRSLELTFPEKTREELYSRILCGEVFVKGEIVKDPKVLVDPESLLSLKDAAFVSRGGDKLYHALKTWNINLRGKVILDAGSSTGGFTDALLHWGADKVHAVDVGYNQIAYKLRRDPRVILQERMNVLHIVSLSPPANGAVADLSFRSLLGAAEHIISLTSENWCIALAKPQFEWRNPPSDFRGVVRDGKSILKILTDLVEGLAREGVFLEKLLPSPITGRKGNREFLLYLTTEKKSYQDNLLEGISETLI